MMNKKALYGFVLCTLLTSAGAVLLSKEGLVFPHKRHIDGKIECLQCHKNIKTSTDTSTGGDIPSRRICNDCHDESAGYSANVRITYRQAYKFNHKVHLAGQGLTCKDCHEMHYKKDVVPRQEIVAKMDFCYQCHDNVTATRYCMLCHIVSTKPDDHKTGWDKLHGKKAGADKKQCMACHTGKESCLRCHKGAKGAYRYHNPNYEFSHKYESRISLKHCRACHSDRQCRDCHKSSGVNYNKLSLKRRHPIGWTNRFSSSFHGKKARMNITNCTTCHTKNECNYCHFWIKHFPD